MEETGGEGGLARLGFPLVGTRRWLCLHCSRSCWRAVLWSHSGKRFAPAWCAHPGGLPALSELPQALSAASARSWRTTAARGEGGAPGSVRHQCGMPSCVPGSMPRCAGRAASREAHTPSQHPLPPALNSRSAPPHSHAPLSLPSMQLRPRPHGARLQPQDHAGDYGRDLQPHKHEPAGEAG